MFFLKLICLISILSTMGSIFAENKKESVTVIGAGLAGLTCAYRLHKAGLDVDLYEARTRVGGRVFTVNVEGHSAELGGQNITDGGEAQNLRRLIAELGLEETESRINLANSYFYDGTRLAQIDQLIRNKQFNPKSLEISSTNWFQLRTT